MWCFLKYSEFMWVRSNNFCCINGHCVTNWRWVPQTWRISGNDKANFGRVFKWGTAAIWQACCGSACCFVNWCKESRSSSAIDGSCYVYSGLHCSSETTSVQSNRWLVNAGCLKCSGTEVGRLLCMRAACTSVMSLAFCIRQKLKLLIKAIFTQTYN